MMCIVALLTTLPRTGLATGCAWTWLARLASSDVQARPVHVDLLSLLLHAAAGWPAAGRVRGWPAGSIIRLHIFFL